VCSPRSPPGHKPPDTAHETIALTDETFAPSFSFSSPTDVYHPASPPNEASLFSPMYHCTSSLSSAVQSGLSAPTYILAVSKP